jgi:hypothetical protein
VGIGLSLFEQAHSASARQIAINLLRIFIVQSSRKQLLPVTWIQ